MKTVTERFLTYVKHHTTSDESSDTFPSTKRQLAFAAFLAKECEAIGLQSVSVDAYGYVTALLPGNTANAPTIGFISHMDTSPDASGENVLSNIVENYDGKAIPLNGTVLSPKEFPSLKEYIGQTLITSDGTTLLGADDKAGIAEILTAAEYLLAHPEIPHGAIRIAFTPDEEIGKGVDFFDVDKFHADFAYTLDGGRIGELEYENFNAAQAKVIFKGLNVHPGTAKGKMVNASNLAVRFASWLPAEQRPEHTEGYEGFFHLIGMNGGIEEASLVYIIRDHSRQLFEDKKHLMETLVKCSNELQPGSTTLEMRDQYYNMREIVESNMFIVDLASEAMKAVGVKPLIQPIRGGTDGARLSFMGLPCPNLFTGGHNFHGRYEYIPLPSLQKAMETVVKIIEMISNK